MIFFMRRLWINRSFRRFFLAFFGLSSLFFITLEAHSRHAVNFVSK